MVQTSSIPRSAYEVEAHFGCQQHAVVQMSVLVSNHVTGAIAADLLLSSWTEGRTRGHLDQNGSNIALWSMGTNMTAQTHCFQAWRWQ
jgi:hypothetical protein